MSDECRNAGGVRLIWRGTRLPSFSFPIGIRRIFAVAVSCVLLLVSGVAWGLAQYPAPVRAGNQGYDSPGVAHPQERRQEHLPQWFRQHQYLPPWAQERALRSEPGFNRLPPAKQQRLLNRLRQLDAMPPLRRERTLQRMEAMERLSPEQRQRVRNAVQQVTQLPEDRQQMIHRAFRDLTQAVPQQREAILNSPQFKLQFSAQERELLEILMSVEPYNPEPHSYSGRGYGERR